MLTVIDSFHARVLWRLKVATSLAFVDRSPRHSIRVIMRRVALREPSRWTTGSEFTSNHFRCLGLLSAGIDVDFIRPGKPVDNAHIESFNGRLRDECLNAKWFESLDDARKALQAWRWDYNEVRPHSSFGGHASFGVCGADPGRCPGAVFTRLRRRAPGWTN